MAKKSVSLTVDGDILMLSKNTIVNHSKLFEDLLKEILEIQTEEQLNLVTQLKHKEEIVNQERIKIVAIKQRLNNSYNLSCGEEIEAKEQERIWTKCFGEARNNKNSDYKISEITLNKAESILKIGKEKINKLAEKIVDENDCDIINVMDAQSWKIVKKQYLEDNTL